MKLFRILMLIPLCMLATFFSALTVISYVYQAEPASAQETSPEGSTASSSSDTSSTTDSTGSSSSIGSGSSWDSGWGEGSSSTSPSTDHSTGSTSYTPSDSGSSQTSFNSTPSSYASDSTYSGSSSSGSGGSGSPDSSSYSGSMNSTYSGTNSDANFRNNYTNDETIGLSEWLDRMDSYRLPETVPGSAASGDPTSTYGGGYYSREADSPQTSYNDLGKETIRTYQPSYAQSASTQLRLAPSYLSSSQSTWRGSAQVTHKPFNERMNLLLADPEAMQLTGRIVPDVEPHHWFVETTSGQLYRLKVDDSLDPVLVSLATQNVRDVVLAGEMDKSFFTGNVKFKVEALAYETPESGQQIGLYSMGPDQAAVLNSPLTMPVSQSDTYAMQGIILRDIIARNSYPYPSYQMTQLTQPRVAVVKASDLPMILMIE